MQNQPAIQMVSLLEPLTSALYRHVTFKGLTIAHSSPTGLQRHEVPSGGDWALTRHAAIFVEGPVESVAVVGCLFDQPGGNGIMLSNDVLNSEIVNSSFIDVGDSAILSVGSSRLFDATAGGGARIPWNNLIAHNLIDTVGCYGKQTAGYFKALSRANVFRHNVLFNGPRSGVNFNDGGPGGEILEGNLVLNFVRESGDHGMFNSWDRQPYLYDGDVEGEVLLAPRPHQIHGNMIFNKNFAGDGATNSGYAFDYDDGSSQYNASGNVMVGARRVPPQFPRTLNKLFECNDLKRETLEP